MRNQSHARIKGNLSGNQRQPRLQPPSSIRNGCGVFPQHLQPIGISEPVIRFAEAQRSKRPKCRHVTWHRLCDFLHSPALQGPLFPRETDEFPTVKPWLAIWSACAIKILPITRLQASRRQWLSLLLKVLSDIKTSTLKSRSEEIKTRDRSS